MIYSFWDIRTNININYGNSFHKPKSIYKRVYMSEYGVSEITRKSI